jgi:hypothetical protein
MAIWVDVNRAAKFPEVVRVYGRAGFGQGALQSGSGVTQPYSGNPPNSAPRGFLETVRAYVSLASGAPLPSWIRKSPGGGPGSWQDCQVDVTTIPGVRPLNTNGKSKQFIA